MGLLSLWSRADSYQFAGSNNIIKVPEDETDRRVSPFYIVMVLGQFKVLSLLLNFWGHTPTHDLLRAAVHMFPQMVLREKTGLLFLGRPPKRDRGIRNNVD
eukprot:9208265-Pyramimonas_sp.AAC.1